MESDNLKPPNKKSNPSLMVVFTVAIIALVGGFLVYNRMHKSSKSNPTKTETTESPDPGYKQSETELKNYKQEVTVLLTADGPSPQTLNIPTDTKIVWQNQDSKPHQLAISPGTPTPNQFYNNRTVDPAGGYPFVIHQTGTFHYYYVDNPIVNGTIIVR